MTNMSEINWTSNDFNNGQSSSGTNTGNISGTNNTLRQAYQHGSLTKGLVAYYPMEKGQGQVLHDGAFDNLGQINGATWNGSGKVGNSCLNFDGSDGSDLDSIPKVHDSYTISVWVKQDGSTVDNGNSSRAIELMSKNAFYLEENNGNFILNHYDGSHNRISASHSGDTWIHYVGTYEGTNSKLFKNGVEKSSQSVSSLISTDVSDHIGQHRDGSSIWSGQIDDVRIYDRALSRPEVQALHDLSQPSGVLKKEKSVSGQNEGGISRYKLNGTADDTWGDNNGTNNGADLTATGVYGQAGDFDGSNSHIEVADDNLEEFNSFSFSHWVYLRSLTNSNDNGRYSFAKNVTDQNGHGVLYGNSTTDKAEWVIGNRSDWIYTTSTTSISTGKWYHISGTYNGSKAKIFLNGRQEGVKNVNWSIGSDPLQIGRRYDAGNPRQYFDGKIDDIRIYDKALTPLQVEKLYHKGSHRINRGDTLQ